MFAAKAGAKHVYGVSPAPLVRLAPRAHEADPELALSSLQIDMSNIADQATKIVAANGFADSESCPERPLPLPPRASSEF